MKKLALISVYDKTGIVDFANELQEQFNFEIISTGKTAQLLAEKCLKITSVSDFTKFPEILDGRVKTLHPMIFGGILADLTNKKHVSELRKYEMRPFSLVVVNLYPFEKERTIEQIDIGGVSLIRAAAKNYSSVGVVCSPEDYGYVLSEMQVNNGMMTLETRKKLAAKAFRTTAYYDTLISEYLGKKYFEEKFVLAFSKTMDLRYGENPHQKGAFYTKGGFDFKQIQGKKLSFNNILDVDAAVNVLSFLDLKRSCAVVVKHTNPCGVAYGGDIYQAFERAWSGDTLAAFGGIVGVNETVDEKLATHMIQKGFFEVLVCPEISEKALEAFSVKKNLRIMVNPGIKNLKVNEELDFKHVRGGILVQEPDTYELKPTDLKIVTKKRPTKLQMNNLFLAWELARVSKSNTIVLVKNEALVSSGVGQQDRKRCCELAVSKAGKRSKNCVCASDAFFPFSDGPEILIKAGVKAIIQPGGSIRDQETIDLCNKYKVAMVFTGVRCFKH